MNYAANTNMTINANFHINAVEVLPVLTGHRL
jgi:hypothetical protein